MSLCKLGVDVFDCDVNYEVFCLVFDEEVLQVEVLGGEFQFGQVFVVLVFDLFELCVEVF